MAHRRVVRGPNVMRGYLNRPADTAKTIVDGWLHTGDVGRFDEDGYLVLVDRIKDMIIRGGENIYHSEIEAVLYRNPAVAEAAVIGTSCRPRSTSCHGCPATPSARSTSRRCGHGSRHPV